MSSLLSSTAISRNSIASKDQYRPLLQMIPGYRSVLSGLKVCVSTIINEGRAAEIPCNRIFGMIFCEGVVPYLNPILRIVINFTGVASKRCSGVIVNR